MSTVKVLDAKALIEDALRSGLAEHKVRVVQFGSDPQPPSAIVGPPRVEWSGYAPDPIEAEFTVFLVSAFDGRVVERLVTLLEPTIIAIETVRGATVGADVNPTTYIPAGLPCYAIPVSVALS